MRTVLRPVIIVLMITLALSACAATSADESGQEQPTSTPIPTAPAVARPTYLVQRGDVQDILDFSGRWQARDQMILAFEVAGKVRRVNVQRGDTVTAGQLLADLDVTELENQLATAQLNLQTAQEQLAAGGTSSVQSVADAEIALANARLNLESAKAGSPWTAVESARINMDSAKQALDNAQRAYDNAISHPEQPASTVDSAYEQLQNARNQLRSAQASYDSAAQNFNNHQFQVSQSENGVIQAELNLEQARQGGGDPTRLQAVQSAQLNIDQINASIARSSLYTPIDAEVLEVDIKPGDAIDAFQAVIIIGRSTPKEAVASLAINDAQRLSVGMVGVCQVLNQPESAVQCVVRRIPLSARDADQTTRVAASLDDSLPSGQLIEIQMPLEVSHDVLWLPPAAIRTFQNRTFVVLRTPDGPRSVDVQLGLQTADRVEIVSGVSEGDVIEGP